MIARGPQDRARLAAAEARLGRVSEATGGFGVEAIWLDDTERSDPRALPDAVYVNRGDPYVPTLIYDLGVGVFVETGWGDWLADAERRREDGDD